MLSYRVLGKSLFGPPFLGTVLVLENEKGGVQGPVYGKRREERCETRQVMLWSMLE